MNRDKYIQIRVSEEEKATMKENAGGKSLSEYLRGLGLREKVSL